MRQIKFTIRGNQENSSGNPIPYYRVTSQSRFSDGTKRYHAWGNYVRAHYLDALGEIKKIERADFGDAHDFLEKRPIKATKDKIRMSLMIHWKDKTHADSDNIFKGIADALFMNDKYVVGDFDYDYVEKISMVGGSVDVTITFL